jgi:hypothetical protein
MNTDIDKLIERTKAIFTATQAVIDGMNESDPIGRRKQIKDIAEAVGLAVGEEPAKVLAYVNDFAHNNSAGYVTRGKFGGFIKGVRPLKTAKVSKTSPAIASTDAVAETDTTATV